MGKDLVVYDGGVVPHVDVFDGDCGNVGDHDATEGIGKGYIDVDEFEHESLGVGTFEDVEFKSVSF